MTNSEKISVKEKRVVRVVYLLVLILVFEGLLRKLAPHFMGNIIFFLKDFCCFYLLFFSFLGYKSFWLNRFKSKWKVLLFFFLPLLVLHSFYDPILMVWGAKLYLMYPIVVVSLYGGFRNFDWDQIKLFFCFMSFLLVPTGIVAVLQNSLPPTHWLNLSVNGQSLEAFSAAGYLRVSSTFSFAGQYAYFLNVSGAFFIASFFIKYEKAAKDYFFGYLLVKIILVVFLIISIFITGGRTAVLGVGAVFGLGFFIQVVNSPKSLAKMIVPIIFVVLLLSILPQIKPEYFAAYDRRSSGYNGQSNTGEIVNRILGSFTGGSETIVDGGFYETLFGKGIGVMTNGSSQLSSYADFYRSSGVWTETDFATTAWEGGVYLVVLWYGFRVSLVLLCFRVWLGLKSYKIANAVAFLLAYVIINGITGTLSLQPPLSIWWYIAIGMILIIGSKFIDTYETQG